MADIELVAGLRDEATARFRQIFKNMANVPGVGKERAGEFERRLARFERSLDKLRATEAMGFVEPADIRAAATAGRELLPDLGEAGARVRSPERA
jgi:hypothetical protein